MDFIGTGLTLSGNDYARAASVVGCDEAAIRAVVSVEARGDGFDAKKRPVVLFEPHVFYRNLGGDLRRRAVDALLAYPDWRPGAYPKTQDERYRQIDQAMAIHAGAALMAASWGLGQVLGENHGICGFKTPQAMVEKCLEGEGAQLDVMMAFIRARGLGKHLISRDWAAFAHGYNGAGYARNDYDGKLRRAYERTRTLAPLAYSPLADGLLSLGDKGPIVAALQRALGVPDDGDFGPVTDQAAKAFQREHGLTIDGKVGRVTGKLLGLAFWG